MIERWVCYECNNHTSVPFCSVCNKETKLVKIFPEPEQKKRLNLPVD